MTPETPDQDPILLGEILQDLPQVLQAQPDPERVSEASRITRQDRIAGLQEVRTALIRSIIEAREDDETVDRLQRVEQELIAVQAEELDERLGTNGGSKQDGNDIIK